MITRTAAQWRTTPRWQQEMARAIREPEELVAHLQLPAWLVPAARRAAQQFPLRVPHAYLARMQRGDPADPLLRQVLPLAEEYKPVEGFDTDPVGDLAAMATQGILQKYRGRVLLTVTGACAVHCRYCFRRHYPYAEANPTRARWQGALDYLQRETSIHEVILSGGDPLSLGDDSLAAFVSRLEAIPHIRTLRIHTRQPVVLPSRIDDSLLQWLSATRLQTVVVIHANHANELDDSLAGGLRELKRHVGALLNQSVLLAGVNDERGALVALSQRLFECGVLPYYLHTLDRVAGAAHFEVPMSVARQLHAELRAHLPGYLVPRLVREIPGEPAKTPL